MRKYGVSFFLLFRSKFSAEHFTYYHNKRHPNLVSAIFNRYFYLVDLAYQQTTCIMWSSSLPWPLVSGLCHNQWQPRSLHLCVTVGRQLVVMLLVRGSWQWVRPSPGAVPSSRPIFQSLSVETWKPTLVSLASKSPRPISQHWSLGVKKQNGPDSTVEHGLQFLLTH